MRRRTLLRAKVGLSVQGIIILARFSTFSDAEGDSWLVSVKHDSPWSLTGRGPHKCEPPQRLMVRLGCVRTIPVSSNGLVLRNACSLIRTRAGSYGFLSAMVLEQ